MIVGEMQSKTRKADVSQLLDTLATERPSDIGLTVEHQSWSFSDLRWQSLRAASRLASLGAERGQIIAFPMENSFEQTAFFFGAWRLGATPLPLPPTIPDLELEKVLTAAGSKLVVRDGSGLGDEEIWQKDWQTAPRLKAMATGGSTGAPKVIIDTDESIIDFDRDFMGYSLGNTLFVPGPTYHSGPISHLTEGLARGKHVVLMRKFDAARALELITRHRPHFALFVPTMMHRMLQLPADVRNGANLSSLKRVWHTAAPCPPWLKERWIEWVGGDALWEIFGGSEGVSVTVISGTEWLRHPGSVGRVVSGEIAILDDECRRVPAGQIGEIYMRSRGARRMIYSGDVSRRMHEDWESFGDLGWIDDEGYLFLADRRRDMIIAGGQNIYPAEIEAAILSFPGVVDVGVFGHPDDDLGEIVCALICSDGRAIDEAELRNYLARRLVRYKIPRRIAFTSEPLRNDAGKVRRSSLKLPQAC
jgi:bile acid-coenzyme A ligase